MTRAGDQVVAKESNDTLIAEVTSILAEKAAHSVKNADAQIYTIYLDCEEDYYWVQVCVRGGTALRKSWLLEGHSEAPHVSSHQPNDPCYHLPSHLPFDTT